MRSIVRTMKILAAVSIRQYEKILSSLGGYSRAAESGLQVVLKDFSAKEWAGFRNSYGRVEKTGAKTGIVVFGSDMGMCGQFNEALASHAGRESREYKEGHVETISIGEKIIPKLEDAGLKPSSFISYPAGISGSITPVLQELLEKIEAWRDKLSVNRVVLFYNRPLPGAVVYSPDTETLLPVGLPLLEGLRAKKWESSSLPLFNMGRDALLAALIRQLLYTTLFRAFIESLTSENAARLMAMQAAEKHIDEHIEELNNAYNQARQDQITSELLDIIAGFETMKGSRD